MFHFETHKSLRIRESASVWRQFLPGRESELSVSSLFGVYRLAFGVRTLQNATGIDARAGPRRNRGDDANVDLSVGRASMRSSPL